jgi:hypothetical protein
MLTFLKINELNAHCFWEGYCGFILCSFFSLNDDELHSNLSCYVMATFEEHLNLCLDKVVFNFDCFFVDNFSYYCKLRLFFWIYSFYSSSYHKEVNIV